ncbi:MAG: tRNA lysidine(34) synthetase TilS [Pseudomonadota bacterium]
MAGDLHECLRVRPANLPAVPAFRVAYSGGIDSHVLLHLLKTSSPRSIISAVHIHHGLQSNADGWAQHCEDVCQNLDIPCQVIRVNVSQDKGASLEESARKARYVAFADLLDPNEILCMAHHADDQAETVLLRMLKGAGPNGLAGMPATRQLGNGWLWRPLLTQPRETLVAYANQHKLRWIEDTSNTDTRFDRNFLRQNILPTLKERWPGLLQTFNRTAAHQQQTSEMLKQLGELDWQQCRQGNQLSIPELH